VAHFEVVETISTEGIFIVNRDLHSLKRLPPRRLSTDEQGLLHWLLEHGPSNAKQFLPQLQGILAVRSCTCGCPSISLMVADGIPDVQGQTDRVICDFSGATPEGLSVGVLGFQDAGRLTELEIYPYDDPPADAPEFGFPSTDSLSPFEISEPSS
jgi:hypothetical protein